MKVKDLLIEAERSENVTVGDLIFDEANVRREGLKMPGTAQQVAPDGKRRKEWISEDFEISIDVSVDSLEGCPLEVEDKFRYTNYRETGAKNLIGAPVKCRTCEIQSNALTSLEGAPKEVKFFTLSESPSITSLKHSPEKCDTYMLYNVSGITSLEGISQSINQLSIFESKNLTSLHNIHKQIKRIDGEMYLSASFLKSHILGILLIPGLTELSVVNTSSKNPKLVEAAKIINKYLPNDRGNDAVVDCQNELLDAGLEDFAQL